MIFFSILEQIAQFLPLIIGAYISMSLMKITNFSIESAYLFGAIMASKILSLGYSGIISLILVLTASTFGGALVGAFTAFLYEKVKFTDVLSAIITIGFFYGLAPMMISGSQIHLSQFHDPLKSLYFQSHQHLFISFFVALFLYILFILFIKTQIGMSCAIYGNNKSFLKNYHINQSYVVTIGLLISNGLAGISGYMVAQNNGIVDLNMGTGISLLCLSSLILGKSIRGVYKPIQASIPFLGTGGYFLIQAFLLKMGFHLQYFTIIQAIMVASLLIIFSKFFKLSSRQDLLGI
ncbi:hypothetical protein HYV11_03555 [Candidatus Dependentiae bacterium]|nr:hypothetical protein [Candidatus Dependentiae bacterium]